VEQLPELHPEQEWPAVPGTAWGTPLTEVLIAEKTDILRLADLWHFGHSASKLHWVTGRICSNFDLQPEHTYSYIGI
jgi:hypothetical protein